MINTKVTLQNLHERFPDLNLDDLFAILECIVEDYPAVTWTNPGQILGPTIY